MRTGDKRNFTFVRPNPTESSLGDLIVMLYGYNTRNDIVVVLPTKAAHFAPLFENLAPVLVTDMPDVPIDPPSQSPRLRLTEQEIKDGKSMVSGIPRPVAICPNCSLSGRQVRECSIAAWITLCDKLTAAGYTPIQFGLSRTATRIPRIGAMLDLSIRALASVYAAIGLYAGVDTGDRWLMLAVGGKAIVIHAPDSPLYPHKLWHWGCDGRAVYVSFDKFDTVYGHITGQ